MTAIAAIRPNRSDLDRFLSEHPETAFVDAIFIDLCGIVRGKRYPRDEAERIFDAGLQIPYSIYLLDVTGVCHDPCGRGFSDGDPDGVAVPVPGSLVPVPWAEQPRGQVLMTMNQADGSPSLVDPRNVARRAAARLAALGLRPTIAFELEFYLLDRERDPNGHLQPPISPLTGRRPKATQVYRMTELDEFADFFRDVEAMSRAQRVPASVATTEYAPGQFEVNLHHVDDPLAAADHCALQRHIVKSVAARHGMDASFLSKPLADQTGSGMHVHMSLYGGDGRNVFDDGSADGSEVLRHAIGGLAATMPEGMAIFAPNLNAYRRFGPNLFVPVAKSWAANNRSVAFRIPAGSAAARRIEHRVAGADANPYLVLAALLAGVHHGVANHLDPGPPSLGNASRTVDPDVPLSLEVALERLQGAKILPEYLGREYIDLYCATKRKELDRFKAQISPLELEWYL